ncbi:MAG TPA: BamA/TamA family outer membrane protein [Steroidobacteraceae bacterium]|nr:BamA/TamA family outer membrane protein [Steroidobacteraceae bacterium]
MLASFFPVRPRPNAAGSVLIASRQTSGPAFLKHSPRRLTRAALALTASAPLCLAAHGAVPQGAPPATAPSTPAPQVTGPIRKPQPRPKKARHETNWLNPTTWPVLPVPLTAVDPNNGTTLGVIPTMLVTNPRNEITDIIAPDIMHNPYFGWGAHGRILAFPSQDTQWSIVAGGEERIESTFDAIYQTGLLRDTPFTLSLEGLYDRSGTARFYGFGNNSFKINQTVYIDQQIGVDATLGWNITHAWQLSYTFVARKVKVIGTTLPGIPPITSRFEGTNGIGTTHELLHRVSLVYDTRDDITIPTRGMQAVVYGGVASRNVDWDASLFTEVGGDGRFYWSPYPSLVVAAHVDLRYEPTTHEVPFWGLSSLGGDTSVVGGSQTLRGYGTSRFYDRNSFSANLELRQTVLSLDAFSTHIDIQVAPFIDTGRVFRSASTWPIRHLHNVFGVGFRGIAPPSVVGYVDIGKGHEGIAVFTGIGYPF